MTDEPMTRIGAAVELSQRGEREAARTTLADLWDVVTEPLHRCAVAHALADVQDDVHEELAWDLRALDAAREVTDDKTVKAGMLRGAGAMLPSLHLNLGDDYRRLGNPDAARRQLALGRAAAASLDDDGYGRMIRMGLERLAERLDAS